MEKTARLEARLEARHQQLFQHAAALRGQSVTDFVVAASLSEAGKAIAEHSVIALTVAEQQRFVNAVSRRTPPNAALKRAAAGHRQLIEPS
jgi:uncharacterized protein (DUF1778 family)